MKVRIPAALCAVLAVIFSAAPVVAGVDPVKARGISLDKVYDFNGVDAVNTFNGNLTVNIPIGPVYQVGDGLTYQFHLAYNSTVWEQEDIDPVDVGGPSFVDPLHGGVPSDNRVESVPNRWFNAGLGWQVTLGELRRGEVQNRKWIYSYVSPDGASHLFYAGLHTTPPSSAADPDSGSDPAVSYTRDGSYIRLKRVDGTQNDRIVETPDGVQRYYQCTSDCLGPAPQFFLRSLTDSLGNTLNVQEIVSGSTVKWRYYEGPVGNPRRYHEIVYENATLKVASTVIVDGYPKPLQWTRRRVDKIDLAGPVTTRSVYDFTYALNAAIYREGSQTIDWANYGTYPSIIQWNKGVAGKDDWSIDVDLLEKVTFPAGGLEWKFAYYGNHEGEAGQYKDVRDATGRHPWSDIAGRLKTLTLPTTGTITYRYGRRPFPTRNCEGGDWDPGIPTPTFGKFHGQVGIIRRTEGQSVTFYGGFTRDGLRRGQDPCATDNEYLGVVVDSAGKATVNFYSIGLLLPYGNEYGLPYARRTPPDADGRYLSQQTWDCKADYMWKDGAGFKTDLTYIEAQTRLKAIARDNACARDAANPTVPVRSLWLKFDFSEVLCAGDYSGPDCIQSNQRRVKERTIYHDDGGVYSDTTSIGDATAAGFDGHGNFRTVTTDGTFNSTTFPSGRTDKATTYRNYNPGKSVTSVIGRTEPWVLSTYTEEQRRNDAGVTVQRSWFKFETNGFLSARRIVAGSGTLAANDVLTVYARTSCATGCTGDDIGSVIVTESDYGGDVQTLGTTEAGKFVPPAGEPAYKVKRRFRHGAEEYAAYLNGTTEVIRTSKNTIDPSSGLVLREEDASGLGTSYTYDAVGRPALIQPDTQASIGYDYGFMQDASGVNRPALRITRPSCTQPCTGTKYDHTIKFDAFGRLRVELQTVAGTGGSSPASTTAKRTISYLPNGWKAKESTVKAGGEGVPQSFTVYGSYNEGTRLYEGYDIFGRSQSITAPDDHVTTKDYTGDRLVKTTTKVGTSSTAKTSVVRWDSLDRYGNVVKVVESTADALGDLVTTYDYDPSNRLISVVQGKPATGEPKQTRTFTYDRRGFLTGERMPELPTAAGVASITYETFDARGHHKTRKFGTATTGVLQYTYDKAERLRAVEFIDATDGNKLKLAKSFDYHESNTDLTCATGKMIGRLSKTVRYNRIPNPSRTSQIVSANVQNFYSYGNDGNLAATYTGIEAPAFTVSTSFRTAYQWDDVGNLIKIDYPACTGCGGVAGTSRLIQPAYSYGRVTTIPGFARSVNYHPNGVVAQVEHVNNVKDVTAIDANGLPRPSEMYTTGVVGGNWNASAINRTMAYDGDGNMIKAAGDWFSYDGASRLKSACVGGVRQDYSYDQWGNLRTLNTFSNCTSTTPSVERSNGVAVNTTNNRIGSLTRRIGGVTTTSPTSYDAFGNVTVIGPDAYDYDIFNMPNHVRTTDAASATKLGKVFLYDASDERVGIADYRVPFTSPTGPVWKTRWTWFIRGSDAKVLREFERVDDSGGVAGPWSQGTDYVYVNGRLLASSGPAGARDFHTDHLGTPRLITNSAAQRVALHTYFPFGEEVTTPDQDPSRMRFTGHERDNNNTTPNAQDGDLDYMHARYFAPMTGRFLSIDPAGISLDKPQSWNRYAYCLDNPVNCSDPSGRTGVSQRVKDWLSNASYQLGASGGDASVTFTAGNDVNGDMGFKAEAEFSPTLAAAPGKLELPGGLKLSVSKSGVSAGVAGFGVSVKKGEQSVTVFGLTLGRTTKENMNRATHGAAPLEVKGKAQVGPFSMTTNGNHTNSRNVVSGSLKSSLGLSVGAKASSSGFVNITAVGRWFNNTVRSHTGIYMPQDIE